MNVVDSDGKAPIIAFESGHALSGQGYFNINKIQKRLELAHVQGCVL